nr:MAG TPA: hypothetical protein [Caudoviricetes sp.]DAX54342.1 MAG TPA: hypothetical protein [Caudoviricetes sp.]
METKVKMVVLGKKFTVDFTMRALIKYQQLTNKSFNPLNWKELFIPKSLSQLSKLFYCCAVTTIPNFEFTYELFMKVLDDHPMKFVEFAQWLNEGWLNEALERERLYLY